MITIRQAKKEAFDALERLYTELEEGNSQYESALLRTQRFIS